MPAQILIVDDHNIVRASLRSLLSSRPDWQICGEAVDGVEAVEKAKVVRPDVVLMDVSMPRMDGVEATRILRRELPRAKVVLVSQNDPVVTRRQAKDVGADAFVAKSDLHRDLISTIEKVLSTSPSDAVPKPILSVPSKLDWLAGTGELGDRIRAFDWSQTSLGSIDQWPQSLKTSVNLILNARHPMWVGWGKDDVFLYNDAYIQVLSLAKHPFALGKPAADVWPEIWDICGPLVDKVFQRGEASFLDDVRFLMNRGDFVEETYYSFSYSPIRDESGAVAGLFCPTAEVTPKVIHARRLQTLAELSSNALLQKTTEAACVSVAATLAKNTSDIPFALLYLIQAEDKQARLEQACGIQGDINSIAPSYLDLENPDTRDGLWPLAEVKNSGQSQVVSVKNVEGLPLGIAQQRLSEAIVLPVTSRGEGGLVGFLIAGVSPARKLDIEYRTFYELVAGQTATAIQNARAAEEERKRLEALAEIDRAKTAFFSNVSHEFRTPLTLMLGPVEELLAKSHTNLSPAAKSQLEVVNRNGSRLLRLVNTLLDFSRIEAGRMQAIYQPTDLAGFTTELASVFRSATERAGLSLELDCPKLAEPVFVDRGMWEKIVLNLISNAFKFTFEGKITVSLTDGSDHVELRVHDTGVGIPAQEIRHLFDRFHRIENARSRTHEGSGIGLALVQELVKLHGGSVRAESELGKGSSFIVSLPTGKEHLPADRIGGTRTLASTALGAAPFVEEALRWLPDCEYDEPVEEVLPADELIPIPYPAHSGLDAATDPRPHILIADDNADMRQYLERLLSERYRVQTVPDGEVAVAAAREHPPALVLSDVMMPNLDGFGLLRELRSDPKTKTIPIILLSARAGEESRVEGMEQGADDYLIKPFSSRELLARVQTHLEMARVRKTAEEDLRRRSEQFETLLNEAPLGVYLIGADFRIREMNPTATSTFGNDPDLIGRDFNDWIHSRWPRAYADEIVEKFRHTLETGESHVEPEWNKEPLGLGVREIHEWQINRIPLPEGGFGVVCYFRDISRQVQAREAIAESEKKLRLATEAAELGIWRWYPAEGTVTWENDRPYAIFGRAREAGPISASEFRSQYCHPDDLGVFEQAFSEAVATGARLSLQCRFFRQDRSCGWVEFTGQVEHCADGSPLRMLGTVLDITQRKRVEETLLQHRERFDLLAEAAHVGFWFCDLPFDKLMWDNLVKEHFWLPSDADVTIEMFYERLHPDDRERTRQAIADSNANNTPYDIEYRTVSTDGREKWIRALGHTFYDSAGQPTRFDGLTLDITERKHIEERERRMTEEAVAATAKFRAVFEQTPVFAGIMSVDGEIIDANQLCLDACGYSADQVLGFKFWNTPWWRLSKENQDKIRTATRQAAQGNPYREILTYHWSDGTERMVDFALHPIVDHEGKILFLHPTGVDITELKRAEENYRRLAESLDAEVRARTRELEHRNVEVVRQSEQLRDLSSRLLQAQDQERRRIARELHDSAGQLLTALGINLARIAQRLTSTTPQFAKEAMDSQQLVQQLSQEIRTMSYLLHPPLLDETGLAEALRWYTQGLMERSGLDIKLTIDEDFGRLPREMELVIFRLVQECLTNIHRHSGSKSASILLAREKENVSLVIEDEGKGISPERLAAIQSQGSGVGIRGMRERLRKFDGDMKIESSERGTRISFTISVTDSPDSGTDSISEELQAR